MSASNLPEPVREALDNLVQLIAREYGVTLEVHQRVAAVKNAAAALRQRAEQAEAKAEANARDARRLEWFDSHWFSAYRSCDPIDGLSNHCVVVDESKRPRRGNVGSTMREAIDQAMQEPQP